VNARAGGRFGILGGSFNPVHIGHLRLALEVRESLALDRVILLPCALPPHKPAVGLLPFALRLRLLRAATRGLPLRVDPLEGKRDGPSYTWDSLTHFAENFRGSQRVFILGCEDFAALPTWRRGVELPSLADFVVVPRDGAGKKRFLDAVRLNWPEARPATPAALPGAEVFILPAGFRLQYLPLTRLDVSASLVRSRFLAGCDLRLLLPGAALSCLEDERKTAEECWGNTD
jgi:nicotinate-nucleotide adenylyltransferase